MEGRYDRSMRDSFDAFRSLAKRLFAVPKDELDAEVTQGRSSARGFRQAEAGARITRAHRR